MNYNELTTKEVNNLKMSKGRILTSLNEEPIYNDDGVLIGKTNELQSDREELGNYLVKIINVPKGEGSHSIPKGFEDGYAVVQEMKGYFLFTEITEEMPLIRMYNDYEFFAFFRKNNNNMSIVNLDDIAIPNGYVLLDVTEREQTSADGIILDKDRDRDLRERDLEGAIVLKVADDVKDYKAGDEVFLPAMSGSPFQGVQAEGNIDLKSIPASNIFFTK